jgi:molybdate transport system substrate-binding protein
VSRVGRTRLVLGGFALFAVIAGLAGCGGDDEGEASASGGELIVSAAASLEPAFTVYADEAGFDAKQSFAGSDELAAQIRQGVRPDVYAAANTSLPDELHADGLAQEPVVFATNRLVLAVPADSDQVRSLNDLTAEGITLAIGEEGVPVGDYTREVLSRLGPAETEAILANVRSEEPDVAWIVGKLTQGAVDAGFVYITDVVAADGALDAIELPGRLQPDVAYGAAVVEGAENPDEAQRFIAGLLEGAGAQALLDAGFEPPP